MTDLLQPYHVTKALDADALTLRGIDLQSMYQDTKADISRVRDVIRATRQTGSFDFLTARRQLADRLASAALDGTDLPDEVIERVPSDTNLKLTIEGLNGKLAELERKLVTIRSEHKIVIATLANHHIRAAGESYLLARQEFVRALAAMIAIDRSLANAGLPATNAVVLEPRCDVPILLSEKKPMEAGWSIRLNYLTDQIRGLPDNYRDSLAQLGLTLKLEG
jgi:hypothetical protein